MGFTKFPLPTNRTVDFTSSGTWTCPAGVYSAEFLVVGAGGGGGGTDCSVNTRSAAGGGGGGGAVKYGTLAVTPGSTYTITVGAGGAGGNALAGANGGISEVLLSGTSLIRCYGGGGGLGFTALDASSSPTPAAGPVGGNGIANTNAQSSAAGGAGSISQGFYVGSTIANLAEAGFPKAQASTSSPTAVRTVGWYGYNGYGSGGSGGGWDTVTLGADVKSPNNGAGAAGYGENVAGAYNGSNATIAGCGGGGSTSYLTTNAGTGGNGANGLVRITYFA